MRFVSYLAEGGLSYATISAYLSGLRFFQIASGSPDPHIPSLPQLHYVLRGIRRAQSHSSDRRLPVTPEIMQILFTAWSNPSTATFFDRSTLWAACCLGFFGFMRSGEFTCPSNSRFQDHMLAPRDVAVHSHHHPSMVLVLLRRSKTDPFGQGMTVFVGRTAHAICPVAAILCYLAQRGSEHGPLFRFEDGSSLSRQRLVTAIRSALQSQGVPPVVLSGISGHSFRIGAATAAARAGVQDSTIQTLGRWRSSSFLRYIRTPGSQLASVSPRLLDPLCTSHMFDTS